MSTRKRLINFSKMFALTGSVLFTLLLLLSLQRPVNAEPSGGTADPPTLQLSFKIISRDIDGGDNTGPAGIDEATVLAGKRVKLRLQVTNPNTYSVVALVVVPEDNEVFTPTARLGGVIDCFGLLGSINDDDDDTQTLPGNGGAADLASLEPGETEELDYNGVAGANDEVPCIIVAAVHASPSTAVSGGEPSIAAANFNSALQATSSPSSASILKWVRYLLQQPKQLSNPITITVVARDLGDAPDSSNHLGNQMRAYTGTPIVRAEYPTVFDAITGAEQGPMHRNAAPLHLGQRASRELDADLLPDGDTVRNINPNAGIPNRDRYDDGLAIRQVNFTACQAATLPVRLYISPRAVAHYAATPQADTAYLNVWVDGDRDGKWQSASSNCPNGLPVREHILIDKPIDVVALGAGLHNLSFVSDPIYWETNSQVIPAWVRITLSDKPASKPLNDAGVSYGDGRGPAQGYLLGETEDYYWLPLEAAPNLPDLSVALTAAVSFEADPISGGVKPLRKWLIRYRNDGDTTAENALLSLDFGNTATSKDDVRFVNALPGSVSEQDGLFYVNLGTLEPGEENQIIAVLIGLFKSATPSLPTLLLSADIAADGNDSDPADNSADATTNLVRNAPVIIQPGNGTTSAGNFEISGLAEANAQLELFIDKSLLATVTADSDGKWLYSANPGEGFHKIAARYPTALLAAGAEAIDNSANVQGIIVDPALPFNPLSLRIIDSKGHNRRPLDPLGRTDSSGWRIHLRQGEIYTVAVQSTCSQPSPQFSFQVGNNSVSLSDPDGDQIYRGSTQGLNAGSNQSASLNVVCDNNATNYAAEVLIDPEGVVYDALNGQPLAQSEVACLVATDSTRSQTVFALWAAANYGQINPQSTAADGYFSFFTPAGTYQLAVNRAGYQPYRSVNLNVVDEAVRYDVPLTPQIARSADVTVTISENGFEPAVLTVTAKSVIAFVNLDSDEHSVTSAQLVSATTSSANVITGSLTTGVVDSGLLSSGDSYFYQFATAGQVELVDRFDSFNQLSINVDGTTPSIQKVYLPVVSR